MIDWAALGDETVDLLRRYLMIDTTNPPGNEIAGTSRTLTFDSARTATIARGAPIVSDTVKIAVPALARMAISLYLPGDTGPCTCHNAAIDDTQVSAPGPSPGQRCSDRSLRAWAAFWSRNSAATCPRTRRTRCHNRAPVSIPRWGSILARTASTAWSGASASSCSMMLAR